MDLFLNIEGENMDKYDIMADFSYTLAALGLGPDFDEWFMYWKEG